MNKLNKEDIKFLKELQHEMLIQDTYCQASPRFWVVQQKVRTYGVDEDYGIDGTVIVDNEDPEAQIDLNNKEEILDFFRECLKINCKLEDGIIILEEDDLLYDNKDIIECIENNYGYRYYITNYKDEYQIVENTFFLTLRECKEHIERNHYHYNCPRPYVMTAWRSPQVERLYKILAETDWSELENE